MGNDVVIDTNVLVHASNCNYEKQQDCIDFINSIMSSSEFMCIDEYGGTIVGEYKRHLKPGMMGHTLFFKLIKDKRIKEIDRSIDAAINKKINQSGIIKSDRVFVRITYKSEDKILVSHDFDDFTNGRRNTFKKQLNILIIESAKYILLRNEQANKSSV
jgi:hypothetical protein